MADAVKMEHICKSFSGVHVLEDVEFCLRKGEIHALMGANGAGKSTLIKILSGAHKKDSGTILIDGEEADIHSPVSSKAHGIQCIYQELSLAPDLSVANNIFLGQEKMKGRLLDQRGINREAARMMEDLDLHVDVRMPVSQLGIGERFFTEICRCLVGDAKIVILDEPTSAMTPKEYKHFLTTIKTLRERGISIIYISHHLDEIFDICDRVTVLRDGKNVATTDIADLTMQELIFQMIGKDVVSGRRMVQEREFEGSPVILRLEHVTTQKLKDVSLELHAGEVLAVSGLLGAGKTELADAVFGEDSLLSGQIYLDGKPVKISHPQDAMRLGIALVNEDRKGKGLFQDNSIKRNISISSLEQMLQYRVFVDRKKEAALGAEMTEKLSVKCAGPEQLVRYLSGGNQQKVVLAKWLLRNPRILILDEPTRGIDVGSKDEIYSMIASLAEQGIAILLLSSEMPEVLSMAHRIVVLKDGEVRGELPGNGTTQNEILMMAAGE